MKRKTKDIPNYLFILMTAVFISSTSVNAVSTSSYSNMTLEQLRLALWYDGHDSNKEVQQASKEQEGGTSSNVKEASKDLPEELERALQKALEIVS